MWTQFLRNMVNDLIFNINDNKMRAIGGIMRFVDRIRMKRIKLDEINTILNKIDNQGVEFDIEQLQRDKLFNAKFLSHRYNLKRQQAKKLICACKYVDFMQNRQF